MGSWWLPQRILKEKGAQALSKSKLFAVVTGSWSRGESAVDLIKHILYQQKNGLTVLQNISSQNLTKFKGVVMVKATKIKATLKMQNVCKSLSFRTINNLPIVFCCLNFWVLFLVY